MYNDENCCLNIYMYIQNLTHLNCCYSLKIVTNTNTMEILYVDFFALTFADVMACHLLKHKCSLESDIDFSVKVTAMLTEYPGSDNSNCVLNQRTSRVFQKHNL